MKKSKTLNEKDLLIVSNVWNNLPKEEKEKFKGGYAEYKIWAIKKLEDEYE